MYSLKPSASLGAGALLALLFAGGAPALAGDAPRDAAKPVTAGPAVPVEMAREERDERRTPVDESCPA